MDIYQNSNCLSKFLKQSQVTLKEQNSTVYLQQPNRIQIYMIILKYIFLWYSLWYVVLCHHLLQNKLTLLKNKVITLKKVIIMPKMFFKYLWPGSEMYKRSLWNSTDSSRKLGI